jgi:RND family efflux transporter MFP subunit
MFSNHRSLTILGVCLLLLIGCEQQELAVQQRLRSVKYQEITAASAGVSRTFSGLAKGSQEANLSFKIAGTIESLPVKVGDHLKANQLIAQLDGAQYELQVQQAQAALAQATASQRNARAAFERLKGLYENNNASRNDLDAARASSDSGQAQVQVARKSLELTRLNLSYTRLRLNKACDIAEVNVENNENVSSGQSIVKVSCGQQMNVEVAVPGNYVTLIKQQMPAEVTFGARPGEKFSATVSEVSVASIAGGTTFPITVELDDNPAQLRSGMVAEVNFHFNHQSSVKYIVVPAIAISEDMQGRFAYIVELTEDKNVGVIKRHPVTVGELTSQGLEIIDGLKIGDKIVTAGVTVIRDKLQVKID